MAFNEKMGNSYFSSKIPLMRLIESVSTYGAFYSLLLDIGK